MTSNITATAVQDVPISRLKHYPNNPRRGDIAAIADSLTHHGQYRPVVAQKSTNYILAGNHTVKAAKKLGWTMVAVTYVDCDDQTARAIVLADNRLNDLADYDQLALKEILESLPDLEGTGFTTSDIAALDSLINDPFQSNPPDPSSRPDPSRDPEVRIGGFKFTILKMAFEAWNDQIKDECEDNKDLIRSTIKARLGIPEPRKQPKTPTTDVLIAGNTNTVTEPVNAVKQHPLNARQGDVGEIMESLKQFGQYRPIVANRQTGNVLVGNHTYTAAILLGWDEIAVTWVDCDETEELKIVLVDNRTSDLATYDQNDLVKLVLEAPILKGTGYTQDDIADIQAGTTMRNQPIGKITIKVGSYSMRINTEQMSECTKEVHSWQTLAERLQFPLEACRNSSGVQSDHDNW